MKLIARFTNEKINDWALAQWTGQFKGNDRTGTTIYLFGLRGQKPRQSDSTKDFTKREHGWGLDFETETDNLIVDRVCAGTVVKFDQHPLGREPGRIPSTDWSFRDFLSVMFLREGKQRALNCYICLLRI